VNDGPALAASIVPVNAQPESSRPEFLGMRPTRPSSGAAGRRYQIPAPRAETALDGFWNERTGRGVHLRCAPRLSRPPGSSTRTHSLAVTASQCREHPARRASPASAVARATLNFFGGRRYCRNLRITRRPPCRVGRPLAMSKPAKSSGAPKPGWMPALTWLP